MPTLPLIFELSRPGRAAVSCAPHLPADNLGDIPAHLLRTQPPALPEVSELQVVRHYTRLSQQNFSIDTHFYPLGSCTMKYNPKVCHTLVSLEGFSQRHPLASDSSGQGVLACLYELQQMLAEVTGMAAVSLAPAAGAQGEFAGVAMIRAYHQSRGDTARTEILIPDAAHGTNPASAVMCGYKVREIPTTAAGDVDLAALRQALGPQTAGLMLTNPSTLGVFERNIETIAQLTHAAGGLLYYDGANLNAILGKVRPGDMGFDVVHLNLHKTFATPHGSGGPGAGPVGASPRLAAFLPQPVVVQDAEGYRWRTDSEAQDSIGRMTAFGGNIGVLLRAYIYARMLGAAGCQRVAEYAALNAAYLLAKLRALGLTPAYPERQASHEFVLTLKPEAKTSVLNALTLAKRLLDHGMHAPTTYFPLRVPEALLVEPTETEDRATLDAFVAAVAAILAESQQQPNVVQQAPHTLPVRRLDEVRAARELDLAWQPPHH